MLPTSPQAALPCLANGGEPYSTILQQKNMANEHASAFLDYFLDLPESPGYAVMVDGKWGVGKTFFIKRYLTERQDKASPTTTPPPKGRRLWRPGRTPRDPRNDRHQPVFVSLNGVSSPDEVNNRIFAQLYPALDNKIVKAALTAGSRALNAKIGYDVLHQDDSPVLQGLLTRLSGRTIVFDDLERTNFSAKSWLGLISGYVERGDVRVIALCNEEHLSTDLEYKLHKEKVIGKTLKVQSDPEEVLSVLLEDVKNQKAKALLGAERAEILSVFRGSGEPNFRSLRFVIQDFDRLCSTVDRRYLEAPEAMKRTLLFMLAVGSDLRANRIEAEDIPELTERSYLAHLRQIEKKPNEQDLRISKFFSRYSKAISEDPIIPPAVIGSLFQSGLLDITAANEAILRSRYVVGTEEVEAWRILWDHWSIGHSDFVRARTIIQSQLARFEVTETGVILHVAGIDLALRKLGSHIAPADRSPGDFYKAYVSRLIDLDTLTLSPGLFNKFERRTGFDGLGFIERDDPEFSEIFQFMAEAATDFKLRRAVGQAEGFLEDISRGNGLPRLTKNFDEGGFADVPLLASVLPNGAADIVIDDLNIDGALSAALARRYQSDCGVGLLEPEWQWFYDFCDAIESRADQGQPPTSQILKAKVNAMRVEVGQTIERARAMKDQVDGGG
jgi:KAP family P-loop domain.